MDLIQEQNFNGFTRYLDQTDNTICGRHPIQLLLAIIELAKERQGAQSDFETRFVNYA